jgi:hypothetical protein
MAAFAALVLSVLKDWRVIAATAVILLAWALFRYVGLVYRKVRSYGAIPMRGKRKSGAKAPVPAPSVEEEGGGF